MAQLKGLIKLTGQLDGLSFYEMNGKIIVRKTGGFDGKKIKEDANYSRVRENSIEFAQSARAGKYFRSSIALYLKRIKVPYVHNRIVSLFQEITKFDTVASRGNRKVFGGLITSSGIAALQDFEFDKTVSFSSIFPFDYRVNFEDEALSITNFNALQIKKPKGATTINLEFITVGLDFDLQHSFVSNASPVLSLDLKAFDSKSLLLETSALETVSPIVFGFLFISFSQVVNGASTALNHSYLKIVGVKTQ